jgi:hypothetical protein
MVLACVLCFLHMCTGPKPGSKRKSPAAAAAAATPATARRKPGALRMTWRRGMNSMR